MSEIFYVLINLAMLAGILFLAKKYLKERKEKLKLIERYKDVYDIDKAVQERQTIHEQVIADQRLEIDRNQALRNEIIFKYKSAKEIYDKLLLQIKLYETDLENIDFGIHPISFSYDTSDDYKNELVRIVNEQKNMVSRGAAATCTVQWSVEGSRSKGEQSTKRFIKLMLKAFNGECDSLIAKVSWNNIKKVEERIKKTFESLNKLGESNKTHIEKKYLSLKLQELKLTYEYAVKKYEEKEEQRRIREEMREEERAARELKKAEEEALKEEERYQKALDKAREDLAKSDGVISDILKEKIAALERQLEEAHQASQRAISRAQETKSGHVYVISNIGCFGEEVLKIGMTRRLEPMDRVKELGDASVPFEFDVHAMIYSENAPALENQLHRAFHDRRINMVNHRKEYFRVQLSDIAEEVKKHCNNEFTLTKIAEAKEYRETMALISQMQAQTQDKISLHSEFPDVI